MEVVHGIAVLTGLTALFAAYIAWAQFRLGEKQFRSQLYERRYAVFLATRTFLLDVAQSGRARYGRCQQFRVEVSEAAFLFGKDIEILLDEMAKTGFDMAELYDQMYSDEGRAVHIPGTNRSEIVKKHAELSKHLYKKLNELKVAFKPYLTVF